MADLTSLYHKKPKRDLSIQACVDCLNKIALEFPKEFPKRFFTDYLDISGGTQPPKSHFINEPKDGYIRFLQIRDFASENTPTYIPELKNNKTCTENDIVLGRYGASVGKILTGKAGAYNVACAKIIFLKENEVDRNFLFYWLHSSYFQNFLTSISRSAQGGFNKNDISRIEFNIPSLEIQKKFASLFKEIDNALLNDKKPNFNNINGNKIELKLLNLINKFLNIITEKEELYNELTHQLNLIKQLRQAFLREAMQGKLVKSTNTKETGQQLLEKIKAEKAQLIAEKKLKKEKELPAITEDEIPFEIPEHWAWCRLGEICTKVTDGFHNTPPKVSKGFPYIAATQVKSDKIDWNSCNYVEEKFHRELYNKTTPKKGEILVVNIGAGCGTPAVIDVDYEFSFKNTAILKFNQDLVFNKYLFYYFILRKDEFYLNLTKGGLQPFLSLKILNEIDFPLSPLHEQEQIVAKLEELMAFCDGLEQSIKESQGYNEKLLQQVLREALQPKEKV